MTNAWPERIDPLLEPPGVTAHHLKKYEFAREFVRGVVIDVACGVGYGTDHLTFSTTFTVGVEIDADAVKTAQSRYARRTTVFVQADAEALPFKDGSADVVTCFEGIEHFTAPDRHVKEAARILRPNGLYVVSTPQAGDLNDHRGHSGNPHHVHEFARQELVGLLQTCFDRIEILGQHRLQTAPHRAAQRFDVLGLRRQKWFRPIAKALSKAMGTTPVDEATLEDFSIDDRLEDALELVLVCRKPAT